MSDVNFASLLAEAKTHQQQGNSLQALSQFDHILLQIPREVDTKALKEIRLETLSLRGDTLQGLGRQKEAIATYNRYYIEAGGSKHAVRALVKIGRQQTLTGDHHSAMQSLTEANTLAMALNDTEGRAQVHHRLGNLHSYVGRYEDSLMEAKKALALYQQLGDDDNVSAIWNNIGVCYAQLGIIDKANEAYTKGLSFETISSSSRAMLLLNIGENHVDLFALDKALGYLREALPLVDSGSLAVRADILRNIGGTLFFLGQEAEAIETLYESLAVANEAQQQDIIL